MSRSKQKGAFRLIIWNELRDLWIAIFPPAPIREKLGGATSLTAILALFGFLLGVLSVVFSYRSYFDGFAQYASPATASVFAYVVSGFIGVFMLIAINLFMHNFNEWIYRWGNPIFSVLLATLITCIGIGYYDSLRMQVGGNVIAENVVGPEVSLIREPDVEYLRQRRNYERLAAQSLATAAWCSSHRSGGKVIQDDHGNFQIVCQHGNESIAISGPGVNSTTKKAHTDHDHYLSQIVALEEEQRQKDADFRAMAQTGNEKRAAKLTTISSAFDTVTTWLYGLQALLAFFQFSILISAAKKAGVSLTGEAHTQPAKTSGSWSASAPFAGFVQAHHKEGRDGAKGSTVTGPEARFTDPTVTVGSVSAPSPIHIHGSDGSHTHTKVDGYEITCDHCGTKKIMKSKRARFCSDTCRKSYHKFSLKS